MGYKTYGSNDREKVIGTLELMIDQIKNGKLYTWSASLERAGEDVFTEMGEIISTDKRINFNFNLTIFNLEATEAEDFQQKALNPHKKELK